MKQKATDERKHDTKHHLSCWARRRRPPTHWRRLFLKKSLRCGFSFFGGGTLGVRVLMTAKCERPSEPCWRLYTPPMYVYTVKELSSIYRSWECGLQQIRTPLADWNLTQYVGSMVHNRHRHITGAGKGWKGETERNRMVYRLYKRSRGRASAGGRGS
jgi:hypothetical protein